MGKKNSGAENIRVVIRTRDLLPYESERGDKALVRLDLATNQVIVQHPIGDPDVFAFDAVYNNTFTQRDIFLQEVQPLADAVLQGYNATVFAYGQSGSGKTHTMTGKLSNKEKWGMMPQVVDYLFNEIKKMTSSTKTFKVKVSYVELYNGKSRDLLATKQVTLEIKQNMAKNFYVKGADMPEVTSFAEAIKWFNAGTDRRQTASTDLNDTSSRSHSLFTVQIEQFDFENDPSSPIVMTSKINVVDLAGSEKLSKTNATGDTAKEGCNINLSLSALATVIDTIVKGAKHIPYRGSPLTMLLKDSLGGNAKTVMFANVGPSDKNTSETISTLRFALRAKQIENKPLKNMDPKDARIQDLLDQIEELKHRLGNVDLNVEDTLRQRIEELEIENSDLRGGGEKNNLELEDLCRNLQAQIEEKEKKVLELQKDLREQMERRELVESNLSTETGRMSDLRNININFIQRVCSDEQIAQIQQKMPKDGSYNLSHEQWDVKEIGFYLHGFAELYEHWRQVTYTQEDMEKYARRAVEDNGQQTQLQVVDITRMKDDLERQLKEEVDRRALENEAISQLKVELSTLREENVKLREKIERDQEKIKAKVAKAKEEIKATQDQLEATRAVVTEKDRDIERLKRMMEEVGPQLSFAHSMASGNWGPAGAEDRSALVRQLEEERSAKTALEHKIKETNISLRRFGVCIAVPNQLDGGDAAATSNDSQAFVLAAADERPIDGDLFLKLQQQIRMKQRLTELRHQHQLRLDSMMRKYELLKTGQVTSNSPAAAAALTSAPGAPMADEAALQAIRELLQRKEEEIENLHTEKDQVCDKLVKKLNKNERRVKELESLLEEERAQMGDERAELAKESAELQKYNQHLAVELGTVKSQLEACRDQVQSLQRAKEAESDCLKEHIAELQRRFDGVRSKAAEFEELQKSFHRVQQQLGRTETALQQKTESQENNRQMVKWSNELLEREKKKAEELETTIRQQEMEIRRQDDIWKAEIADREGKWVAANNRRLEQQTEQFQVLLAEEHAKQKSLHKKLKSAKAVAAMAAQRYDELILENEDLATKLGELKVTSMKMYLEKQEAQRDLDAMRPNARARAAF